MTWFQVIGPSYAYIGCTLVECDLAPMLTSAVSCRSFAHVCRLIVCVIQSETHWEGVVLCSEVPVICSKVVIEGQSSRRALGRKAPRFHLVRNDRGWAKCAFAIIIPSLKARRPIEHPAFRT
ncbi:unnamed protein product, partial [Scytosiphon promiscuus]